MTEFLHVIGSRGAGRGGAGRGVESVSAKGLGDWLTWSKVDVLVEQRDNVAKGYRREWKVDDQLEVLQRDGYQLMQYFLDSDIPFLVGS